jgi:carbonic anhydrase
MHNRLCRNGAAHGTSAGGRRRFVAVAAGLLAAAAPPPKASRPASRPTRRRAPREGGERFGADTFFRPKIGAARRPTARGQGPFAAPASCADGRVAPERVFSRGIGEPFVVRTAGNVADAVALGSVGHSVAVLGSPRSWRWGAPPCGDVAAAGETAEKDATSPGSSGEVARPVVAAVQGRAGDKPGNAVRENAMMAARGHHLAQPDPPGRGGQERAARHRRAPRPRRRPGEVLGRLGPRPPFVPFGRMKRAAAGLGRRGRSRHMPLCFCRRRSGTNPPPCQNEENFMRTCDCGRHEAGRSGRRAFLGAAAAALACAATGVASPPAALAAGPTVARTTLTPDQALKLMKDGNGTFKTEAPYRAVQGRDRRLELARGQAPFCVLVGCSDSRVPPELLFGRGLGELFIIRNAGNTVDTAALGSIEYGVGVLGCPLVVVLGHEACGAVAAAVDVVEKNATFPGVIGEMIQPIIPAVLEARRATGGTLLDNSVVANAKRVATRLRTQSPVLQEALRGGKLKVVPAHYDLDDGHVDFFED